MDARHRIGIIAAAVAVAAVTGGRVAASSDTTPQEPLPDTDLGRAAQYCVGFGFPQSEFTFYDDGLSVLVTSEFVFGPAAIEADDCMLGQLDLPEWIGDARFVGVLTFGDWSVMRGARASTDSDALVVGTGGLWILDNEVAPDS